MKKFFAVFILSLFAVLGARADNPASVQGRWEFVVTSGDTQYQLDQMGQTTFSTVLLQNRSALTNVPMFTTDTSDADQVSDDNITAVGIQDMTTMSVTFTVAAASINGNRSNPGQLVFNYKFTGKYNKAKSGLVTVSGTYTTTVGSAYSNGSGNFVATFFPGFSGALYSGALDPDAGSGPTSVPALLNPTTRPDSSISGTITVAQTLLTDGHGNSCFAESNLVMQSGLTERSSGAWGIGLTMWAKDSLGRILWLSGYSANPNGTVAAVAYSGSPADGGPNAGTNGAYVFVYAITGGPCDGFGGFDDAFTVVKKNGIKRHTR